MFKTYFILLNFICYRYKIVLLCFVLVKHKTGCKTVFRSVLGNIGCNKPGIDQSWSLVSSLLWEIMSPIDYHLNHRRKLNPCNTLIQQLVSLSSCAEVQEARLLESDDWLAGSLHQKGIFRLAAECADMSQCARHESIARERFSQNRFNTMET